MERSQAFRARILDPFLKLMTRCRVSPNQLTLLSLVAGLAFCPLFARHSKPAALAMLLLHVLLDGLDGPLARYQNRASSQGSFTDTMVDQLVVTFTTITLIATDYAGIWAGGLYVFFYTMVVIFAMVRSALAIPYSWLVRPRFIVYLWIPVEVYLWRGSLDYVLWLFIILLAAKMLTGFIRIRRVI
jgi:phosphatidylglycerophosphate synthase